MKKFFVLAVAMLMAGSAFAASTQFTASATFAGEADFSFVLKTIGTDVGASSLSWTEDAFNRTNDDNWVRAQEYAEITADISKAGAVVLMYTENTVAFEGLIDKPNYNDGIQDNAHKAYGGMVRNVDGDLPSDFDGQYRGYIPILFSMNTSKKDNITSNGSQVTEKNGEVVLRADRFLSEKANPSYSDAYATIAALDGPVYGMGENGSTWGSTATQDNKAYMYFFGNFKNIIGGDTYSTTVKVQQSWE